MNAKAFSSTSKIMASVLVVGGVALAWWGWQKLSDDGLGKAFVNGNGRIEATEIDIATKLAGRIDSILAQEGDFVEKGQTLARMQRDVLQAQREEAVAALRQAEQSVAAAEAQVALKQSDAAAAQALVSQRASELDAAQRRLKRSQTLSREGAASFQELDDDQASERGAQAALAATQAQLVGAQASVTAAGATVARIEADIRDSELKSPRDGRVQFRVAQPGEVLAAGGRVLNLVDLADVYMTFFLPSEIAGQVALGSDARIVLDAAPDLAIPATITFVASTAQFTPKTVETASERQKLMFRVKAQIAPELLREHLEQVKTGLPGVAWIRLDPQKPWPASLTSSLTGDR